MDLSLSPHLRMLWTQAAGRIMPFLPAPSGLVGTIPASTEDRYQYGIGDRDLDKKKMISSGGRTRGSRNDFFIVDEVPE
jgi:hypothetical protein